MRTRIFFTIGLLYVSLSGLAQVPENVDYVAPENNGVIAVKKGDSWSILDAEANVIIEFRKDLVVLSNDDGTYPIFINDRCLIKKRIEGLDYYGYIDKSYLENRLFANFCLFHTIP